MEGVQICVQTEPVLTRAPRRAEIVHLDELERVVYLILCDRDPYRRQNKLRELLGRYTTPEARRDFVRRFTV